MIKSKYCLVIKVSTIIILTGQQQRQQWTGGSQEGPQAQRGVPAVAKSIWWISYASENMEANSRKQINLNAYLYERRKEHR